MRLPPNTRRFLVRVALYAAAAVAVLLAATCLVWGVRLWSSGHPYAGLWAAGLPAGLLAALALALYHTRHPETRYPDTKPQT